MISHNKHLFILLKITLSIAIVGATLFWLEPTMAATVTTDSLISPEIVQASYFSAALATGLSSLGAGIAVASVGSAAIGALAEKPELLGRVLIMVGLAEGIAIYGLIVSILILNEVI
ncbi:MAG: ATP synthase subunit C [Synechococcus sp.]